MECLIGGFVIGLIVGGIAALFRTPRSGNDIRQQIAESGDKVRGKIRSVIVNDPVAESMAEGEKQRRAAVELNSDLMTKVLT